MHFLTWWDFSACFTKYDITEYDFHPEKIYWMKREQVFAANTVLVTPIHRALQFCLDIIHVPIPESMVVFSFLPSHLLITAAFTLETFRIHLHSLPCWDNYSEHSSFQSYSLITLIAKIMAWFDKYL